jgi:ribosome-associated protein
MTQSKELKELIIEGIQERKGHKITVVDLSHIDTAAADTFIIAEGSSTMQVSSIAESIEEYVRINGNMKPYNTDGERNAEWIVMDYGSVWAHIFLPDFRQHYNLEDLWSDAVITEVPDLD